jgi:hypothetical protein
VVNTKNYAKLLADGNVPDAMSDAALLPYADEYLEYSYGNRVSKHVVSGQGCSCTGSTGQGVFTYTYTNGTTEQELDLNGNPLYSKTVYPMQDGSGEPQIIAFTMNGQSWVDYYQYDSHGREILHAEPSAIASYTQGPSSATVTLKTNDGLIQGMTYATTTTATSTTAGDVAGYLKSEWIQHGSAGPQNIQTLTHYIVHTDDQGNATYPVADTTVYRDEAGTEPETTSFVYTWMGTTNQMASKTTIDPVVTAAQNGSGVASSETETYDTYGRVQWSKDANGYLTYTAYDDGTGAVIAQISDVDTNLTADFTDLPTGWSTPAGRPPTMSRQPTWSKFPPTFTITVAWATTL